MTDDFVQQLAQAPGTGVLFAARRSGLARSADEGRTWTSEAAPLAASAVACSPAYAMDTTVWAAGPGVIWRSTDGGRGWEAAALPAPAPYVSTLLASPNVTEDGLVFAGTLEDGVWVSADRGRGWAAWNFGLVDRRVMALAASPEFAVDQTLWAGTESGLFRSWNAGRAWREVALPAQHSPVVSLAAAAGQLWAGTEAGLYVSADGGRWRRLAARALRGPVNAVWVSPRFAADQALAVISADALWTSADGGQNWAARAVPGEAAPVALAGASVATLCVGGADGQLRLAA